MDLIIAHRSFLSKILFDLRGATTEQRLYLSVRNAPMVAQVDNHLGRIVDGPITKSISFFFHLIFE
jgi:hypothetical protein